MSAIGQKISNYAANTQQNIHRQFSDFENTKYVSGTKDFLNSNSLVAKFAFLILVVIVFVLVLRLTIQLLEYVFAPSHNPYIYEGLLDARDGPLTFSSNPNVDSSVPILRSDNESQGLEFTWSIWLLIKDLHTVNAGKKKHIFHKGAPITTGTSFPLTQAPGLWINEKTNTLEIMMDIYTDNDQTSSSSFTETISVYDIPLNKWLNIMIRIQGNILDVFVNGAITVRHILADVVRQNYGNTFLLEKGGFSGFISNLRYYSHSLNVAEILDIVNAGPDLTSTKSSQVFPPYFALRWYFQGGEGGGYARK